MRRITTLLFSPLLLPLQSLAEPAPLYDDLPVVLSITRLQQQPSEIPAAVTLIDRAMIEASGVTDLPDLFRLVAGFQVGHFWNNRTSVTYHGMSDEYARRMQVLIDGRSVYLADSGGVHWADLPVSLIDIERIEVIRGPNGVSFGANAFLGAINIITVHPDRVIGTRVRQDWSDNGMQRTTLRHAETIDNYRYRVTLETHADRGFDDYFEPRDSRFWQFADDKSSQSFSYRSEYHPRLNDSLSLQLGLRQGTQWDGYPGDLTEPARDESHRRYFGQLQWRREFSTDNDFELNLYHIDSDINTQYDTATLSTIFRVPPAQIALLIGQPDQTIHLNRDIHALRTSLELQQRMKPCNKCRLVWGGEVRLDQVEAPGYITPNDKVESHMRRLFAHSEWQLGNDWLLNLGAMYEKSDLGGDHLSPRTGLSYRLNADTAVRLTWTRAYRSPVVIEEYADYAAKLADGSVLDQIWKSPGGLESEEIDSYEFGIAGQADDGQMRYDFTLFRSQMRNLITTPIDQMFIEPYNALCANPELSNFCSATVLSNDGSAKAEGIELQLYVRPSPQQLLSLGYSRIRAVDNNIRYLSPYEKRDDKLTAPVHTLSLLIEQGLSHNLHASAGLYHTGNMRFFGGDETEGITRLDLGLRWQTQVVGMPLALTTRAQHIGNRDFDFIDRITQESQVFLRADLTL